MTELVQEDSLNEKCAVFGAYHVDEAARTTLYGLWALQHRGQESSGIVSSDGTQFYEHSGAGLVASVYREDDIEELKGTISIGHNRYSTSGDADGAHCQPVVKSSVVAFAHNGNLPSTKKVEEFLSTRGVPTPGLNDSEMMAATIACYVSDGMSLDDAVVASYPLFTGVFSSVAMSHDTLVAFRDSCGIRPLSIAKLNGGYVVASETCAFDTVGAEFIRDIQPGEVVIIDADGLHSRQAVPGSLKIDSFEFVYFARPDSIIEGKSVNEVRETMGRELAKEWQIDADIVVPVPDSAIPAAIGYSQASGIPLQMALIKNRYIHRTFIRPSARLREQDLKMKLNPMKHILAGKRVILIDDSIVRGTTTRKIASMIYEAGAREVHILISSPPVKYPDFYGINIPIQEDLIAYQMTPEKIREHLNVDSLGYLSYDGLIRAIDLPVDSISTSCFNGVYPVSIGERANDVTAPKYETKQALAL